jgi:hypothetical protein
MDLLITIAALLVTVYAVLPRERQLDLRLRINSFDRLLILLGFLAVFYFEFNEFFSARGWTFHRPWPTGITPRNAMYLVMVAVTAIVGVRIRLSHLTPGKIGEFRALVEQLYWSESYGELLTLLQRHVKELFRIHDSRFLSVTKPKNPVLRRFRKLAVSAVRPFASHIAKLSPNNEKAQGTARDIIRGMFLSPRFVVTLVRTRPYFGLEVIREVARCQERFDFVNVYLTELMRDTQSALYDELRNNQNCSQYRYSVSASNRLLHFFLSDIKVAENNGIYKPIGDFTIAHLYEVGRDHDSDPYNLAMTDFSDVGAWHSPLFAAIRFFDIMVKEGLFQGIEWHMWLYYTPYFVEGIVRNYRFVDPAADPTDEWPTRYSFLLYEVFSAMRDWIMGLEDVPRTQASVVLRWTDTQHENGNIPKSSILALSQCSRLVLESDHITDQLKRYLMNMVFKLYFDLRRNPGFEGYATVLRTALSQGGSYRPNSDVKYHDALIRAFEAEKREYLIKRPEEHVTELEEALR